MTYVNIAWIDWKVLSTLDHLMTNSCAQKKLDARSPCGYSSIEGKGERVTSAFSMIAITSYVHVHSVLILMTLLHTRREHLSEWDPGPFKGRVARSIIRTKSDFACKCLRFPGERAPKRCLADCCCIGPFNYSASRLGPARKDEILSLISGLWKRGKELWLNSWSLKVLL